MARQTSRRRSAAPRRAAYAQPRGRSVASRRPVARGRASGAGVLRIVVEQPGQYSGFGVPGMNTPAAITGARKAKF